MDSTGAGEHKVAQDRPMRRFARPRHALVATAAVLVPLHMAGAGPATPDACGSGGESVRVAAVRPDLDLSLADGRELQLIGVDPGRTLDDPRWSASRERVAAWLVGRDIQVRALAASPDRWGRIPAMAFASRAEETSAAAVPPGLPSIAETFVAAGLARARPDPRLGGCWVSLLAREREARQQALGLWAQPRYAVIAADDRARLLAGTGSMAIVKGRIVRIVEGRARTYLSFGTHGRDDLALSVERSVMARLRARGIDPAAWRDRDVLARGYLDDRFGLGIELTSADQVEVIDSAAR